MRIFKSKKGFYIPALAFLAIVIIIFIIIMTYNPAVKETTLETARVIAGK